MVQTARWIQRYLLIASPLVLLCMVWTSFPIWFTGEVRPEEVKPGIALAWGILSWNLIAWFMALFVFAALLVTSKRVRLDVTARLVRLKPSLGSEKVDDAPVVGEAARGVYIATFAVIVLLLFLSVFQINIRRVPSLEAGGGIETRYSFSVETRLVDAPVTQTDPQSGQVYQTREVLPSNTTLLILLILWMLGAYRFRARRLIG